MSNFCYPDGCGHCLQYPDITKCPTRQNYDEWEEWIKNNVQEQPVGRR